MKTVEIDTDKLNRLLDAGEKLSARLLKIMAEQEMKTRQKWLDNQDVCILLQVSKRKLHYLRATGKIAYFKLSNKIYYRETDIREYVEDQKMKDNGELF